VGTGVGLGDGLAAAAALADFLGFGHHTGRLGIEQADTIVTSATAIMTVTRMRVRVVTKASL
jgi:hypothetical protein